MIINNSKKALAAKIRNSGFVWPDSGKWAIQDKDGEVFVCSGTSVPVRRMGEVNWEFGEPYRSVGILSLGSNWFQCILSRDEYFHLYPATDADGWIEWGGGNERPVKGRVDIKNRNGFVVDGADSFIVGWDHDGTFRDIIAYRLHKPEQSKSTAVGDDETNLASKEELESLEFEPSPTIEQLAADYRAKLAIAQQAQEEADSHRRGAEAAFEKLVVAGKAHGLVLSVAAPKPNPEPELVITDWRDLRIGDEVEYVSGTILECSGMVGFITEIDVDDPVYRVQVSLRGYPEKWCSAWRFIRRPAKGDANA